MRPQTSSKPAGRPTSTGERSIPKQAEAGSQGHRCLTVIHYPVFGGPHNEALRLRGPLSNQGWNSTVVLPDEPGNAADRMRAGGVDVVQVPLHRLRMTRDLALHWALFKRFHSEVSQLDDIIQHSGASVAVVAGLVNPHAAIAARRAGAAVVWQILDSRAPSALRRVLMPMVGSFADAVMFNGETLRDLHDSDRRVSCPVVVYTPPVDIERFVPSAERRAVTRRELGIPVEAPVVGTVANVNPQKGIEHFIRAATRIYSRRPDSWFLVVGARYANHSAYNALVEEELRASAVPRDRIIFTGEKADVENYYPALDIKVVTSVPRSEGTTTTVLEAMACGVPVVATDVGSVGDVVRDHQTGLLVPPLQEAALSSAVLEILDDRGLAERLLRRGRDEVVSKHSAEQCARTYIRAFEAAESHRRARHATRLSADPLPGESLSLRDLAVCPACAGALRWTAGSCVCQACSAEIRSDDGVPLLLAPAGARDDGTAYATLQKANQARHFDLDQDDEFELSRPHGTPGLYRWLMGEKFRRSVIGLEPLLPGSTVLCVCAGSGMDAEFLTRCGARVVAVDISVGACKRTLERARRFGLPIIAAVADAENLPFPSSSFDFVYVHDGLHHLEAPLKGLDEMARVARRAVSVTEPARAAATSLAIRFGLALEEEEAGNAVVRLGLADIERVLQKRGFRPLSPHRYAMYYPHVPGRVLRQLSRPRTLALTKAAATAVNGALGSYGNKLAVQALRLQPGT